MFIGKKLYFSGTHAVFAGAGAGHAQCALHGSLRKAHHFFDLGGIRCIEGAQHVEVSIAHMADNGGGKRDIRQVVAGLGNAFRQPGDGNANIGREYFAAGTQGAGGEIGIVAGGPELILIFQVFFPAKALAAVLAGKRL